MSDAHLRAVKKYQEKQKALGKCVTCGRQATSGKDGNKLLRCRKCVLVNHEARKNWRQVQRESQKVLTP